MKINVLNTEINISKGVVFIIAALSLSLCSITGYVINARAKPVIVSRQQEAGTMPVQSTKQNTPVKPGSNAQPASADAEEIKIYVIGCVNNPGIVTIKKGQLINDAVDAAGGATSEADLFNINMVYKLKENVMLIIRPQSQASDTQNSEQASGTAAVVR